MKETPFRPPQPCPSCARTPPLAPRLSAAPIPVAPSVGHSNPLRNSHLDQGHFRPLRELSPSIDGGRKGRSWRTSGQAATKTTPKERRRRNGGDSVVGAVREGAGKEAPRVLVTGGGGASGAYPCGTGHNWVLPPRPSVTYTFLTPFLGYGSHSLQTQSPYTATGKSQLGVTRVFSEQMQSALLQDPLSRPRKRNEVGTGNHPRLTPSLSASLRGALPCWAGLA